MRGLLVGGPSPAVRLLIHRRSCSSSRGPLHRPAARSTPHVTFAPAALAQRPSPAQPVHGRRNQCCSAELPHAQDTDPAPPSLPEVGSQVSRRPATRPPHPAHALDALQAATVLSSRYSRCASAITCATEGSHRRRRAVEVLRARRRGDVHESVRARENLARAHIDCCVITDISPTTRGGTVRQGARALTPGPRFPDWAVLGRRPLGVGRWSGGCAGSHGRGRRKWELMNMSLLLSL